MFDRKVFGQRLGAALKARGLSQTEAAAMIGLPASRVSEYVNGYYLPGLDKLSDIIDTLGLDVRILFPEWTRQILEATLAEG